MLLGFWEGRLTIFSWPEWITERGQQQPWVWVQLYVTSTRIESRVAQTELKERSATAKGEAELGPTTLWGEIQLLV